MEGRNARIVGFFARPERYKRDVIIVSSFLPMSGKVSQLLSGACCRMKVLFLFVIGVVWPADGAYYSTGKWLPFRKCVDHCIDGVTPTPH